MNQDNNIRQTNILAVFANPRGSDNLRLGNEDRVIQECLTLSSFRDNISLEVLHAATIHDVRRKLLGGHYHIVQFSGHGTNQELLLENAFGEPQPIPQDALAQLLFAYSPPIECVIFNACYSDVQGELVSLGVPFTIGINGAISDEAATEFTRGFYDAIGAGKDIIFAFEEGCRCVNLTGLSGGFEPILFSETENQEEARFKIISEQHVQFREEKEVRLEIVSERNVQFREEEEEAGILDYILDGIESFETVSEILARITAGTNELGEYMKGDTAELDRLNASGEKVSAKEYKRVINHTAQRIEYFASFLDEETPSFRDEYSRAVDYFGKATTFLVLELESDNDGQIKESIGVLTNLAESIESARDGLANLRQSIVELPRMTRKLNQAKRHCHGSLDNFDRELNYGLQLTNEVANVLSSHLN